MRRIEFLTRPGCGICDEAFPRVHRISRLLQRQLVVVDITTDGQLEDEYGLRIPVLRNEQGRVLAEGPLSWVDALRAVWRS